MSDDQEPAFDPLCGLVGGWVVLQRASDGAPTTMAVVLDEDDVPRLYERVGGVVHEVVPGAEDGVSLLSALSTLAEALDYMRTLRAWANVERRRLIEQRAAVVSPADESRIAAALNVLDDLLAALPDVRRPIDLTPVLSVSVTCRP